RVPQVGIRASDVHRAEPAHVPVAELAAFQPEDDAVMRMALLVRAPSEQARHAEVHQHRRLARRREHPLAVAPRAPQLRAAEAARRAAAEHRPVRNLDSLDPATGRVAPTPSWRTPTASTART